MTRNTSTALTLRVLRRRHGLRQYEVASILKVDRSTVTRWELGEVVIPALYIPQLARLYRVSFEDFFTALNRSCAEWRKAHQHQEMTHV